MIQVWFIHEKSSIQAPAERLKELNIDVSSSFGHYKIIC